VTGGAADVPPPPRTPSESARRLLLSFRGSTRAFLLIGLVFTLVGAAVLFTVVPALVADAVIGLSGASTTGTVVAVETDESRARHHRGEAEGEPALALRVRYTVDGEERENTSWTYDAERFGALAAGAQVPVEYASFAPGLARVEGTTRNLLGAIGWVVLVFPVLGPPLLLSALRTRRTRRRLYREGRAADASVEYVGVDRTVATKGGRHPYVVRYRFRVDGAEYQGSFSDLEEAALAPFQGDAIVVLYDPAAPEVNVPYVE